MDRIRVRGTVKHGLVDKGAPSGIERREIEKRIRADVFPRTTAIEVTVAGQEATIRWAGGQLSIPLRLEVVEGRCQGEVSVSLASLGVKPIWGPLRAFRVTDAVTIRWDVVVSSD